MVVPFFDRKYYQGLDGMKHSMLTSGIMVIIFSIIALILAASSSYRKILGTQTMQIVLFFSVFILNFIAYYHDPTRYTTEKKCGGGLVNCNKFSLVAGIGTFFMDLLMYKSLLDKFSDNKLLTVTPIVLLGLLYIVHYWLTEETENDKKETEHKSKLKDLMGWESRVILYSVIMFLDVIIWFQSFNELSTGIGAGYQNITRPLFGPAPKKTTGLLDQIMGWSAKTTPRFGKGTMNRVMGWGGILGFLFFDWIAVSGQLNYEPKSYGLDQRVD